MASNSRAQGSRRIIQRQGPVPRWVMMAMIIVPGALIVLLLALKWTRPGPEAEVVPVDPNDFITRLEREAPKLEESYQEVQKLLRAEDPSGKGRAEDLMKRLERWIGEWDTYFDSKRDANDKLPADLEGYQPVRRRVSTVLSDLGRITDF
jgi:hypothetical protein